MTQENRLSVTVSVLILAVLIVFFNIDAGEVQPWDEGLYAYRARAILQHNAWFDQTHWAIGGLYSASYPPLIPIAISFNIQLFGETNFSIRFFSSICSIVTLAIFFHYFSKKYPIQLVFLFTINLLLSFHWLFYSRQGMTDIPLICFSFLTILFSQMYLEEEKSSLRITFGIGISFFFFCALMTKVVVSFIPLIFLLTLAIQKEKQKILSIAPYFLLGLILALPWFILMSARYGNEFTNVLIPKHLTTPVEGNVQKLAILYYINQLLIANPSFLLGLINLVLLIFKRKQVIFNYEPVSISFLLWAVFGIILFSLATTQLQHYTVYLLLPFNFLSMDFVHRENSLDIRTKLYTILLFFFSILWYFLGTFRQVLSQKFPFLAIIIGITILLFLVYFIVRILTKKEKKIFLKITFENQVFLLNITILVLTILGLQGQPTGKVFGGKAISKYLLAIQHEKIVYLYHFYNESDKYNPQIAWYTDGKYLSGDKQKETPNIIRFSIPRHNGILDKLHTLEKFPQHYILYYIADKNLPYKIVFTELSETRPIIAITPNYILFGKVKKNRKEIKTIIAREKIGN